MSLVEPIVRAGDRPDLMAVARPEGFDDVAFARELDALRDDIRSQIGTVDADYIRKVIRIQRSFEIAGRGLLLFPLIPAAWVGGTVALGLSKILDNMEIGHNVMHGQYDWMRDPEIHSSTWDWDNACPNEQWRHSHNYLHHQWTNIRGMDRDIGYGIMRIHPAQKWKPRNLIQPITFVLLGSFFQYGVSYHDIDAAQDPGGPKSRAEMIRKTKQTVTKAGRLAARDYVGYPLLAVPFGGPPAMAAAATGAAVANFMRNVWAFSVIFCGHFPSGVEMFGKEAAENESRGQWYRRQILGSANISGGRLMHLMTGNLSHQIEHHLFPDLPAPRYVQIAPKVREICARHGINYHTASFPRQFGSVVKNVLKFSLPPKKSKK